MTDVGEIEDIKSPEGMMAVMSSSPRPDISSTSTTLQTQSSEVDGWIEILSKCKQLAEDDVKRLCDKVCLLNALFVND